MWNLHWLLFVAKEWQWQLFANNMKLFNVVSHHVQVVEAPPFAPFVLKGMKLKWCALLLWSCWEIFSKSHQKFFQRSGEVWKKANSPNQFASFWLYSSLHVNDSHDALVVSLCRFSILFFTSSITRMRSVALNILGTLTKQDYVNVVVSRSEFWTDTGEYNKHDSQVLSCEKHKLVPASTSHKKQLAAAIEEIQPFGGSNHVWVFFLNIRIRFR